ncbi:uncharacterized protein METZ01_LOCUS446525, partial [marine metagenome]
MFSHRPCGGIPILAFLLLFTSLLGGKEEP